MLGAVLIIIALLVVLPIGTFALAAVLSAVTSWSMTTDAEDRHEGSELVELS